MSPDYWTQAIDELSAADPVMKSIIERYRGEIIRSRGSDFETLMRSIVGQQISVKAAQSVWNKVSSHLKRIDPTMVLEAKTKNLRACGLSERKVIYIKDLARHFDEKLVKRSAWHKMTDEDVIQDLIQVKGIGRWTAEMFLMFHLLRPNIFPKADLGLQKAISISYQKRYPMSERQLKAFEKRFQPWASVATWYLWRSLDPIPVEY